MEHLKFDLTEEQVSNLKKLAEYLNRSELPAKFDMNTYCGEEMMELDNGFPTICGSVGCAVGHGPYAGIPKNDYESWTEYSRRAFTNGRRTTLFLFLFSEDWAAVDNTPKGAAKRIEYFIRYGVPELVTALRGSCIEYHFGIKEWNSILNSVKV
jgi:hypothetical protein